jgi:hypothetical protein
MKKYIIIISSILITILLLATFLLKNNENEANNSIENYYNNLFSKTEVSNIEIVMSDGDYNDMLENAEKEEYKSATLIINGETYENVGIRTKGNSSLMSISKTDSVRYSFRIKMDKYVDGQTYHGLDEFVINNMYSDPSYLRELLSYEYLDELGLNTPLNSFSTIKINSNDFGLYLMVEAIEESFIQREFENTQGNLYKQEQGSSLLLKSDTDYSSSEQKMGQDESKQDLINLINVLNDDTSTLNELKEVLDTSAALKYIAANTMLGSYDSYNGNFNHNYYLYSINGYFTIIPWDYNMSMGGFGGENTLIVPIDLPSINGNLDNYPLIKKLLSFDELKIEYMGYIESLKLSLESIEFRVSNYTNLIDEYVKNDPTKFSTYEQFIEATQNKDLEIDFSSLVLSNMGGGFIDKGLQPVNKDFAKPNFESPPQNMPENFDKNNANFPQIDVNRRDNPGMGSNMPIIGYINSRLDYLKSIEE